MNAQTQEFVLQPNHEVVSGWTYLIVDVNSLTALDGNKINSGSTHGTSVTINSDGSTIENSVRSLEWTITAVGDGYTIARASDNTKVLNGGYASYPSIGNLGTHSTWTFNQSESGYYGFKAESGKYLGIYNSQWSMAFSPSGPDNNQIDISNTNIQIFKLKVTTPTFSVPEGTYYDTEQDVVISAEGTDAIYYTLDGSTPATEVTASTYLYEGPIHVATTNTTIKAIAVKGTEKSDIASATYTLKVSAPNISVGSTEFTEGSPFYVSITAAPGAEIHYTTNGDTPTASSPLYESELLILNTTTLKAVAVREGFENSDIVSAEYTIVEEITETITVFDGTTTNKEVPISVCYYSYVRTQFIIPASYLTDMENFLIKSMKFYYEGNLTFTSNRDYTVKMMQINEQTFLQENTSFLDVDATTVYEGKVVLENNEWYVSFSTPFEYWGGNLFIEIRNNVKGNWTSEQIQFYGITANGASISGQEFSSMPTTGKVQNFLPKTTFEYVDAGPFKPRFSPDAGNYNNLQNVTITAIEGASIYYTTDDIPELRLSAEGSVPSVV